MNDDVVEELIAAVRASAFRADDALVARIDAALDAASEPGHVGKLLVTKSLALQGRGDPATVGELTRAAIPHLIAAGQHTHAAFATTTTAVFLDQAGDAGAAIEYAVDALVMLDGLDMDELDSVRASLALSGLYMRRCAFELAVELGRRAFDAALRIEGVPIDAVAFSSGYVAAEGGHVATDPATRDRFLDHARTAAAWLRASGKDDISRLLLGPGLDAEIALVGHRPVDTMALDAAEPLYDEAIADFVAWHRLVRGMAAAAEGRFERAIELIDLAEPGLRASADDHCLVRALRTRAGAKAALGSHAEAYADASQLAELTRQWQLEQVGGLADQLARRAELERSSSALLLAAQRLAADIDRDPLTGVQSRRWLDRTLDALTRDGGTGSVVVFDIDRFKAVNDTFGHHVGDRVLARVGELLATIVCEQCAAARFGGEEFVVLVLQPDVAPAVDYAERVRRAVESAEWGAIVPGLAMTISAGVATGDLHDVQAVVVAADAALLESKRAGRNRVTVATRPTPPPAPAG